ncbi:MAG: pyrimidine reductase family protein [Salinibacterium sp.]|nr:MAG: pyrimidine reductase family protein [Salinibacterium sp.]
MNEQIDRLWPSPASALTDDELVADLGPGVRANFVASVDGAATRAGRSGGLSSAADKRHFELLRRVADVVVVGAGTARIEGYSGLHVSPESARWRVEHGMPEHPVLALVTGHLDLDPSSPMFTDAPSHPIIFTIADAPGAERLSRLADVVAVGASHVDVPSLVAELTSRGLTRVLLEGGPSLFASFVAANAVDELCLTISPSLEGGDGPRIVHGDLPAPHPLHLAQLLRAPDDTLLLRYRR